MQEKESEHDANPSHLIYARIINDYTAKEFFTLIYHSPFVASKLGSHVLVPYYGRSTGWGVTDGEPSVY